MSDDIENTINNFLVEAASMRAALDRQGARVEQLSQALDRSIIEYKRSAKALADMTASGVQRQAAQQISDACKPVAASITAAAGQAQRSMTSKLKEVEAVQGSALIAQAIVTLLAGLIGAGVMILCVHHFPMLLGIAP
ncbi:MULTISPECIES: hypothetical protein [Devosia]|uniref:hypothetical protein n=1 Tax=Devosia TaxID=46913 RepID=UPI000CE9A07F|nr:MULTISPECIES: hypothetical protein [Devosia]AVF03755.1 hypothetical protein C4375_08475 [Devosia sp. I507]